MLRAAAKNHGVFEVRYQRWPTGVGAWRVYGQRWRTVSHDKIRMLTKNGIIWFEFDDPPRHGIATLGKRAYEVLAKYKDIG